MPSAGCAGWYGAASFGRCCVLHSTWLVNSASHVWGYRSHPTRDRSTNLWWVALLTYGEGWHNNHHAYQTSARHGLRWWEIDMTYLAIRPMKLCRIAYNIRLPKISSDESSAPLAIGRLIELIGRGESVGRASACLVFPAAGRPRWRVSSLSKAALAQRQSRGLIRKWWRRRVTFDCEPGELRET